jgi:FAD/FMN-containing dehydrogenase
MTQATYLQRTNFDAGEVRDLRARLAARYPVARFAKARRALDPKNILSNHIVDALLPRDDYAARH